MDSDIFKICGESDLLPELEKIQSDPNFVFEPDPNFNPITLFNEIGDTIMVNSWIECANYVNGGWVNNIVETGSYERNLFFGLSILTCVLLIPEILKYLNRLLNRKKEKTS